MNWIFKNKKSLSEILSFRINFATRKNILQSKKTKTLLVVLFLVFAIGIFSKSTTVSAATCLPRIEEVFKTNSPGYCIVEMNKYCLVDDNEACATLCKEDQYKGFQCQFMTNTKGKTPADSTPPVTSKGEKVPGGIGGLFADALKYMLVKVLQMCGYLFAIAATLFAWVIDPRNVSDPTTGILQKGAIKDVWMMVRDLLNMTFILILLFAAFCTIFQVEKWSLKKVWLNILINALLVNFSFPIARFVIDISNVAFYFFVNNLFSTTGTVTGSTILSSFAATSGIAELLVPKDYVDYEIPFLISSIIFVFIFGMTLLVVAALFVVRMIALAMLIMFSPVGFVGYIFPATSGYADKWWNNLFSYSFFAPIMIFIMMISLRVMQSVRAENYNSIISNGGVNAGPVLGKWIADAAFFAIPVIILWMGMGVAKSFGISGADTVVNSVKKGGKWLANSPFAAGAGIGKYAWKQSGIPGGVKKGYENARKSGKIFGFDNKLTQFAFKDGREGREGGIAGVIGKKRSDSIAAAYKKAGKKAHDTELDEDVKKAIENHDAETTSNLKSDLAGSTALLADALDPKKRDKGVEYMSKYKQLMSDPIRKQEHEAAVRVSALAAIPAKITSMADGSEKTARMEAHVQQQIAATYSDMKTNYHTVKEVHKKKIV